MRRQKREHAWTIGFVALAAFFAGWLIWTAGTESRQPAGVTYLSEDISNPAFDEDVARHGERAARVARSNRASLPGLPGGFDPNIGEAGTTVEREQNAAQVSEAQKSEQTPWPGERLNDPAGTPLVLARASRDAGRSGTAVGGHGFAGSGSPAAASVGTGQADPSLSVPADQTASPQSERARQSDETALSAQGSGTVGSTLQADAQGVPLSTSPASPIERSFGFSAPAFVDAAPGATDLVDSLVTQSAPTPIGANSAAPVDLLAMLPLAPPIPTASPVPPRLNPEPSTLLLLGTGLAVAARQLKRRRNRDQARLPV